MLAALRSADVQFKIIKGGGHRLSEPHEIDAILQHRNRIAGASLVDLPCLPPPPLPATPLAPTSSLPMRWSAAPWRRSRPATIRRRRKAFEQAAKASLDKDPGDGAHVAAAGNMWIAAGQPGKAAFDARPGAGTARAGGRAARRGLARPRPRGRGAERPQDRPGQARPRPLQTIAERSVLLVFLRRAGDPRRRRGDRQDVDRQGAGACAHRTRRCCSKPATSPISPATTMRRAAIGSAPPPAIPTGPVGKAAAKAIEMLGVTPTVKSRAAHAA